MAKDTKNEKQPKRRTQVKELPKEEKRLSHDEQKKIKGGPTFSGWLPAAKPTSGN